MRSSAKRPRHLQAAYIVAAAVAVGVYPTDVAADFAPSAASLDYGSSLPGRAVVVLLLSLLVGVVIGRFWATALTGAWYVLLFRLDEAHESGVSGDLKQYVFTMVAVAFLGILAGVAIRRPT